MKFPDNLRCPITKNSLNLVSRSEFPGLTLPENLEVFGQMSYRLLDSSQNYFYPVFEDILLLHEQYALFLGKDQDERKGLTFDKQRVFDYYNEINYKTMDALKIYEDSSKWVDFREVSSDYIRNSFKKAAAFFPSRGRYLLDIASGPIGLPEYMALSEGYDFRICMDISINALIQARINMERAGKKGIYICGDITNIPLMDEVCDAVLSQHTLYHIPKDEQLTAVNEMYRVAGSNAKIVIVYNWFYHSWFMNLSLNIIQIYRIIRHLSGKIYVRIVKSKPKLYFYPHSPRWFRKSFPFGKDIEFQCWRSVNKYFLSLFIHKALFGKKILDRLMQLEIKHSRFFSTFGDYPVIIITKHGKQSEYQYTNQNE